LKLPISKIYLSNMGNKLDCCTNKGYYYGNCTLTNNPTSCSLCCDINNDTVVVKAIDVSLYNSFYCFKCIPIFTTTYYSSCGIHRCSKCNIFTRDVYINKYFYPI
jgi:hypothetical protein